MFGARYFGLRYFGRRYFGAGSDLGPIPPEIRKAIRARLLAVPAIADLIGAGVYPLVVPQTASYPCVCFGVVADVRGKFLKGPSGISVARVQLEARGQFTGDVAALKGAINAGLDGWRGTIAGVEILACRQLADHDFPDRPEDGSDRTIHRIVLDYRIKYRCDIPNFS